MEKTIDFQKTVYEICTEDPNVMEIMKELGFDQITKAGMLQTAGRVMTIAKGARMKGIELADIVQTFERNGYTVKQ
ncbi:DUF1858 domain-containing protein [Bacillus tuaregi]|uniref:DUF1858 domain-containing protein n=1 Tax=Bacillus tuaregi TaxID=1816695 RepID=UPI0008F8EA9E|nr:DUF1858 domain-containing protein [Bacillus tuaregi]